MKPEFLTTNEQISHFLKQLAERGINRVAVDFEGDQGTVHYHNRISIVQIFDGEKAWIIDVLALDKLDALRDFLVSKKLFKVMFASTNDQYMTQNVLDITIEAIRDIAVAQKLLGKPINIANHIGIDKHDKDQLQRANWIKRPLSDELIEYAVNDVLDLLKVEDVYVSQLKAMGMLKSYEKACDDLSKIDFRINPLYVYSRRIGSYKHMSPKRKLALRTIWIFRELVGEFVDKPVGHLFSKKQMPFWVRKGIDPREEIMHMVNKRLKREAQISEMDINRLWNEALELAENAKF